MTQSQELLPFVVNRFVSLGGYENRCILCGTKDINFSGMIPRVTLRGTNQTGYAHQACFLDVVGLSVDTRIGPELIKMFTAPDPSTPIIDMTELAGEQPRPLQSMPPSVTTADRPPDDERVIPKSDLHKVAAEIADKGIFTVLPFNRPSSQRKTPTTWCKVLIWLDDPRSQ